jgi:hypothetical protein
MVGSIVRAESKVQESARQAAEYIPYMEIAQDEPEVGHRGPRFSQTLSNEHLFRGAESGAIEGVFRHCQWQTQR